MRWFAVVLILVAAVAAPLVSAGGDDRKPDEKKVTKRYLIRWTDAQGMVHITDRLGDVPEQFQDRVEKIEQSPGEAAAGHDQTLEREPSGGRVDADRVYEEKQKMLWQQRLRMVDQRIADADAKYRELEARRNELLRRWGGPASGRLSERAEAEQVAQEMQAAVKELEEAVRQRDVVIPEEARKAGIPPGWLRD